jgi:hypothetical protein
MAGMTPRVTQYRELTMADKDALMTEAQRAEIKRLCEEADVPDKSGERLTQEGAQHFIDDLRRQQRERHRG